MYFLKFYFFLKLCNKEPNLVVSTCGPRNILQVSTRPRWKNKSSVAVPEYLLLKSGKHYRPVAQKFGGAIKTTFVSRHPRGPPTPLRVHPPPTVITPDSRPAGRERKIFRPRGSARRLRPESPAGLGRPSADRARGREGRGGRDGVYRHRARQHQSITRARAHTPGPAAPSSSSRRTTRSKSPFFPVQFSSSSSSDAVFHRAVSRPIGIVYRRGRRVVRASRLAAAVSRSPRSCRGACLSLYVLPRTWTYHHNNINNNTAETIFTGRIRNDFDTLTALQYINRVESQISHTHASYTRYVAIMPMANHLLR